MKAPSQLGIPIFRIGRGLIYSDALQREALGKTGTPIIPLNPNTCASLLQTHTEFNSLQQIHAQIILTGLQQNIYLATKLVNVYVMGYRMEDARQVFDKMRERDVFLWNVMIRGYADNGFRDEALGLYYGMQRTGVEPDRFTFPFVLKACEDLKEGRVIHEYIGRCGFESDIFVGSSLVAMYFKCGSVEDACQVFDKMPERNVVTWSAVIRGHAQNGRASEARRLFRQMQVENVKPNSVTIASVLPTCVDRDCEELYGYVIKNGYELDTDVGITLLDMFAKCNGMEYVCRFFEKFSIKNVMLWNVMIKGCTTNGALEEALRVYCQLLWANMQPDNFTHPLLLKACADKPAIEEGRQIHNHIVKTGFEKDIYVGNSLVAMYAKCRKIRAAQQVFGSMPIRDVASWSAMIAGYAQNGHYIEALVFFHQMQEAKVKPNKITFLSVLPACGKLASLHQAKNIHRCIMDNGLESDIVIVTALIDMYAKCGSIDIALQLFDQMSERNVVTWNAIIDAYGMHGRGKDALALFSQMQQAGVKPDYVTFICVLSACSHAGLVEEGSQLFNSMLCDHCITPRKEHYACMVDLLGRAGHLCEAYDLIESMPFEPSASILGALLSACKIHNNIQLGKHVADWIFQVDPENAGRYVLLSNIYAAAGKWDTVTKLRTFMKDTGLDKTPGCSLIELTNRISAYHKNTP